MLASRLLPDTAGYSNARSKKVNDRNVIASFTYSFLALVLRGCSFGSGRGNPVLERTAAAR